MRISEPGGESAIAGWELTALISGRAFVHELPRRGSVVLGRGSQADVALEDASVSRRHATLHLGDDVVVEDLGSANGTRVITTSVDAQMTAQTLDQRLPPNGRMKVPASAAIHLGSVVLLVRPIVEKTTTALAADGVVVASPAMKKVVELLQRIALAPISVLIVGETGVGKDVIARAIHAASPRSSGPYTAINCAALAEHLVESELFGHEKGAFTGAAQQRRGLFELAEGGTVFLDEVGEIPLTTQVKLLRVLEAREFLRVGGAEPVKVDVRVLAATNRILSEEVEEGRFREDLYYRLNVVRVVIPPLRARAADIAVLARTFLTQFIAEHGKPPVELSKKALGKLMQYHWPGNVRQLRNVIENLVLFSNGGEIDVEDLPADLLSGQSEEVTVSVGVPLDQVERKLIERTLVFTNGNRTRAAELLGISRRTLLRKLKELNMES